jgi:GNAT superfamily N-acetyltransferase
MTGRGSSGVGATRPHSGTFIVGRATNAHLDALVEFETALFAVDAVPNDVNVDPAWPQESGRGDFERLIDADDCLVLVASCGGQPVGHLVAYVARAAPTRRPVSYAVLRSIFVVESDRRRGVASDLIEAFVDWGRSVGCVEAQVDHYASNQSAAALYVQHGFATVSTSRSLTL